MKVYAIQSDCVWEDKVQSIEKVEKQLASQAIEAGSLIVLCEMFSTGFSMNVNVTAEGNEKVAENYLRLIAKKYGCTVIGGVVNLGNSGKGLNQAVVFDANGMEAARYTKRQPFSLAGETTSFEKGGQCVVLGDVKGAVPFIGVLVCYDLRFPELFREATGRGAEILVVIANWPSKRVEHWVTLLKARAIENQAYVVGVNRVGTDPFHPYPGRSMIIDPLGNVLADGGEQECIISADISSEVVRNWRKDFPALRDAGLME